MLEVSPCATGIVIFGGGAMGRALYRGWLKSGLGEERLAVVDVDPDRCEGFIDYRAATRQPLMFVAAVKPGGMRGLVTEARKFFRPGDTFVSIAAGVSLDRLHKWLETTRVARVMPNLTVEVGYGVCAVAAHSAAEPEVAVQVGELFSRLGVVVRLPEQAFDAFTALAGSGPALYYAFVEALGAAGSSVGLNGSAADEIARQVFVGSALLLQETGADPADLRNRVTSPGGTTEAGLQILTARGALSELLVATLQAASQRSSEISIDQRRPAA